MDPEKRRRLDGIREQLIQLKSNRENFSSPVAQRQAGRGRTLLHRIRYTFGSDRCYAVWLKSYVCQR
jgi:hypothetical protein